MPKKPKKLSVKDFSVIDLFCGVGGLTHGFALEKFTVDAGIDFDLTCKYAYERNNPAPFIHKDITELEAGELNPLFSKKKILVGCAPCQPFSVYNQKKSSSDKKQKDDEKWKLLYSFADLIERVEPEIISMENVPQLMHFNEGKVFNDFVARLEKQYEVTHSVVNAQDYGVAQRRKRLILFASKYGKIKLIDKVIKDRCFKTVQDEIGHLPPVEDGVAHPSDPLHRARKLTDINKRRIQAMRPGGFWREWSEDLKLKCHKKESGKAFRSVYGRMKWDDVSPTITTYCIGLNNGRFGHPEQDRAITLREAALLQSFPQSYKFLDPSIELISMNLARHIGNAVPVRLGRAIAKRIAAHIEDLAASRQ
jgi:DNA (cytosine-5)-methyltransferase 1